MTVKQEESAVCPPDALEKRIQQAQLTKCQHRIADYFLKNRNRICRMTSLAIAQEVGVSDASVIRFSRAVGYTGFADLRESLYDAFRQELTSMDIGRYAPAQRLDLQINEFGGLNLSTDFLCLMAHNIEQSVRQNDPRLLGRVVDLLVESRRKLIIGMQGSKSCAMQFSRLLGFLLERVELLSTGESDEIAMLSGLGPRIPLWLSVTPATIRRTPILRDSSTGRVRISSCLPTAPSRPGRRSRTYCFWWKHGTWVRSTPRWARPACSSTLSQCSVGNTPTGAASAWASASRWSLPCCSSPEHSLATALQETSGF